MEQKKLILEEDDGSLAFLQIEPDKTNRQFNCSEKTLNKTANYEINFR